MLLEQLLTKSILGTGKSLFYILYSYLFIIFYILNLNPINHELKGSIINRSKGISSINNESLIICLI